MTTNCCAQEATIFSCNKHPPPPLMRFNSASTSSAPSIAQSSCNHIAIILKNIYNKKYE